MSLLNQNNKKGKKDNKKAAGKQAANAKLAQKPSAAAFVSKQQNTGSQRGS
ncbi:hypothetical protein ABDK00_014330 [Niabella insulamsoli]|uniref:hypothetical protein n=1 Tax=Niabella insulamsoli TaxID=3144874 RepID=UPI0031FBEF44